MEVIGKIRVVDETKTVGAGGFRKRELVVTTDEQYPQYFNAIQGWRVEKVGGAAQPAGKTPMPTPEHFESISNVNDDAHDDLPF